MADAHALQELKSKTVFHAIHYYETSKFRSLSEMLGKSYQSCKNVQFETSKYLTLKGMQCIRSCYPKHLVSTESLRSRCFAESDWTFPSFGI